MVRDSLLPLNGFVPHSLTAIEKTLDSQESEHCCNSVMFWGITDRDELIQNYEEASSGHSFLFSNFLEGKRIITPSGI